MKLLLRFFFNGTWCYWCHFHTLLKSCLQTAAAPLLTASYAPSSPRRRFPPPPPLEFYHFPALLAAAAFSFYHLCVASLPNRPSDILAFRRSSLTLPRLSELRFTASLPARHGEYSIVL